MGKMAEEQHVLRMVPSESLAEEALQAALGTLEMRAGGVEVFAQTSSPSHTHSAGLGTEVSLIQKRPLSTSPSRAAGI